MLKALIFAIGGLKLRFLQKNVALVAPPPDLLASDGWGRCPQTPNGFLWLNLPLFN